MKKYLLLSLLPFLAAACVEPIVMDPLEEMPVVVQCVLTKDRAGDGLFYGDYQFNGNGNYTYFDPEDTTVQYLDLYYARRPGETEPAKISDAVVSVKEGVGKGAKIYPFSRNGERWEAVFGPVFGETYTLEVIIPGRKDHIFATTVFPGNCFIRSFRIQRPNPHSGFSESVSVSSETSKLSRYFALMRWELRVEQIAERTYTSYWVPWDYPGEAFLWVMAKEYDKPCERLYSDHPGTDSFNICSGTWDEMRCLESMKQLDITSPYYADADSYFWDKYASRCTGLPMHKKFLRIHHPAGFESALETDSLFVNWSYCDPKKLFTVGADFETVSDLYQYYTDKTNYSMTMWMVSEEYDRYLRDIISNTELHGDELTTLYSADPMYTNIEGGIGCFGSMIKMRVY